MGGYAQAQYALGMQYRVRKGIDRDLVAAFASLSLARQGRHPAARQSMEAIETELTDEQLREARELARRLAARIERADPL